MVTPKKAGDKTGKAGRGAAPARKRLSAEALAAEKAAQAHRAKMMRWAIPNVAPLVALAILSATRLMDTSRAAEVDYLGAAALVLLTPVAIALTIGASRGVRRAGYALLLLMDLGVTVVGLIYGSKSAWFYGAAVVFALAAGLAVWTLTRDREPTAAGGLPHPDDPAGEPANAPADDSN